MHPKELTLLFYDQIVPTWEELQAYVVQQNNIGNVRRYGVGFWPLAVLGQLVGLQLTVITTPTFYNDVLLSEVTDVSKRYQLDVVDCRAHEEHEGYVRYLLDFTAGVEFNAKDQQIFKQINDTYNYWRNNDT